MRTPVSRRIAALLLGCCILLGGCNLQAEYPAALPPSTATPPPLSAASDSTFEAELYFLSTGNRLVPEVREIPLPAGMTREEAIILALMDGPQSPTLSPAFVPTLNLDYLGLQLSEGVCLAYFSFLQGASGSATEYEFLLCKAAMAQSLYAATGVRYFDMYVDNAPPGYKARPLGALAPPGTESSVTSLQIQPGIDGAEEALSQESRDVVLYFGAPAADLLLCEVRSLQYGLDASMDELMALLINALVEGPVEGGKAGLLPTDMRYVFSTHRRVLSAADIDAQASTVAVPEEEPTTMLTSIPGWGYMSIYLETEDTAYDPLLTYASIVHTVTGFFPRLLGVRLYINGVEADPSAVGEAASEAPDGSFTRGALSSLIGNTVPLCYPDKNYLGLTIVRQPLTQGAVNDPARRLQALFTSKSERNFLTNSGLSAEDVLAVSLQGSLAVVNMREGFFEKLNAFVLSNPIPTTRANTAQLAVFSIINTLCEIPGIERVHLLEGGERIAHSLGGEQDLERLYLGNALYYNPGLMLP